MQEGATESEYLVRWRGYPAAFDTWELAENLGSSAKKLIAEYKKEFID
jgi:hypothetical protein